MLSVSLLSVTVCAETEAVKETEDIKETEDKNETDDYSDEGIAD